MIRDTTQSFGLVTVLFHWALAGLFLLQFVSGLMMTAQTDQADRADYLTWHAAIGLLILFASTAWVLWRISTKRPNLPKMMEQNLKAVARVSHGLLFCLLLVTPLAGWALVSALPNQPVISVFSTIELVKLPLAASQIAAGAWSTFHALFAYMLLFLVLVHALAAFRHQFKDGDDLLLRMIIPGRELNEPVDGQDE